MCLLFVEAERWFERMAPPGLAPDLDSHTSVVLSFARQGDQESAYDNDNNDANDNTTNNNMIMLNCNRTIRYSI